MTSSVGPHAAETRRDPRSSETLRQGHFALVLESTRSDIRQFVLLRRHLLSRLDCGPGLPKHVATDPRHAMNLTYPAASITLEAACALIAAATAASRNFGIRVTIAVTDAGGHLAALSRDDGAPFFTVNVAIDKAWTSASFGLPTHVWRDILGNPNAAQLAHQPRLVAVAGGMPIVIQGRVVGGIGVSGGDAEQDREVAEIALEALALELPESDAWS